jgi:hypothetical protein
VTTVTDDYLQDLIAQLLLAADTFAGPNVFTPRSWRTTPEGYWLLVQSPKETKQNIAGRTGPAEFWTNGIFRIVARLSVKPDAGDAGAMAAQAALGLFKRQIEVAVINADPIRRIVQQFVSVETTTAVKTEGGMTLGELVMDLTLEYFQGDEDFAQLAVSDLTEIAVYADLLNVYSPTGDFTGSEPFDGTPSPRTSGPDGRPEASALFTLPQD